MKNRYLLSLLVAVLSLIPAGRAWAQTFTTLYSFTNGTDGAYPQAGLILSGNTLYGTAEQGGAYLGFGTVFEINTDGTGFAALYSFTNGTDGAWPTAGLILSSNTLYGTASDFLSGFGIVGGGTVFKVNTDGTGFATLHTFTGSDGATPQAGLVLSGNTLYGTVEQGGIHGNGDPFSGAGIVFKVNTDGTGFATLHSFTSASYSDGSSPQAGLVLSGSTLYGTAAGGTESSGTVFKVSTGGSGYATLHNLNYSSDGHAPLAGLIIAGNTLYGTASEDGVSGNGTVFKLTTAGTGFMTLHSFSAGYSTNSDGMDPEAGLILSGNTLYGTASYGGVWGNGTVFQVNTDGTGFATLYSFTGGSDGGGPEAGLILSGNTLYGTTSEGGVGGYGTVFSITLPVLQLAITQSGTNVVLSWPTNFSGATVQSTTNLVSPVWTSVAPAPVVVNGQNTVTNPISGTQQFYRLQE